METKLSGTEIAKLTAVLTGGGYKRANSKEAAIKRFVAAATDKGIADPRQFLSGDYDFDTAEHVLFEHIKGGHATIAEVKGSAPKPEDASLNTLLAKAHDDYMAAGKPKAPKAVVAAADKAPKAEASKEPGKRAAILAAAERGELPSPPDFSAETHKRFRGKLAEVVALAEAGNVAGLEAFPINPISSSPKAIAKYRDLAVIALKARGAQKAA